MKQVLFLLLLLIGVQNCQSQICEYTSEIGFIYNLENKTDQNIICEEYGKNRELFFSLKNTAKDKGVSQISKILLKVNVSQKSVDEFLKYWRITVEEHRKTTKQRDSIYAEGVACLKNIIAIKSKDLSKFVDANRELIASSLSENQIKKIKKGIDEYRRFNSKKKQYFFEEESLAYGELGKNIIEYDQLSFDCIESFMTSQYRFGFRGDYSNEMIELYSGNQVLNKIFKDYRPIEEDIVKKITSKECFKRIGILRYYDALNDEEKERTIKVNMLMNMFK